MWVASAAHDRLGAHAYPSEIKLDAGYTSRRAFGRYAQYYTFYLSTPSVGKEWLIEVEARGVAPKPISRHIILRDGGFSDSQPPMDREGALV